MTHATPLTVDIWSDIACPWCYVGKRRFEEGLAAFSAENPDTEVAVRFHSFELSPDTPVDFDGSEVDFLSQFKGMPREQVATMLEQMTATAAGVGLHYDYDALQHTNTVKAHQLLHWAEAQGRQADMKERLFRAYFVEGRHVGRAEDLADLAAELGLDRADALAALNEDRYLAAVRADQQQAQAYGIQGVPFYVVDGRYGISGAQEPATFAQALGQVAAERAAETIGVAE